MKGPTRKLMQRKSDAPVPKTHGSKPAVTPMITRMRNSAPSGMQRSFLIGCGELPRENTALVPRRDVIVVTGLSRSSIDRRERAGTFPLGIRLGATMRVWRAGDIRTWLDRIAAEQTAPSRTKSKN